MQKAKPAEHPRTRFDFVLWAIVLGGALIRLWDANAPPTDFHAFRQTQTLMVARNFFEHDMNLFRPHVDWLTTTRPPARLPVGGTELCVVPWLTAILYHVFGETNWAGRVVPVVCSAIGSLYLYSLVRRLADVQTARFAVLLISVSPLFFTTGRIQMPEAFAFCMAFAATKYFDDWLRAPGLRQFALATVSIALMLLGKPQLIVMGVLFAGMAFAHGGVKVFRSPRLYVLAVAGTLPSLVYSWYSWSLIAESGVSFAQPQLMAHPKLLMGEFWIRMVAWFFQWTVDPFLLVLAVLGMIWFRTHALKPVAIGYIAAGIATLLLAPGGIYSNPQYLMPFVPGAVLPAAAFCSHAQVFSRSRRRVVYTVLAVSLVWSLVGAYWMWRPVAEADRHAGEWLREHTPREALILVGNESPATLYFAQRMGWICWYEDYGVNMPLDHELINRVGRLGCRILVLTGSGLDDIRPDGDSSLRDDLYRTYDCFRGDDFAVFVLARRANLSAPETGTFDFAEVSTRKYLRGGWRYQVAEPDGVVLPMLNPGPMPSIEFVAPPGFDTAEIELHSSQSGVISIIVDGGTPIRTAFTPGVSAMTRVALAAHAGETCTIGFVPEGALASGSVSLRRMRLISGGTG